MLKYSLELCGTPPEFLLWVEEFPGAFWPICMCMSSFLPLSFCSCLCLSLSILLSFSLFYSLNCVSRKQGWSFVWFLYREQLRISVQNWIVCRAVYRYPSNQCCLCVVLGLWQRRCPCGRDCSGDCSARYPLVPLDMTFFLESNYLLSNGLTMDGDEVQTIIWGCYWEEG